MVTCFDRLRGTAAASERSSGLRSERIFSTGHGHPTHALRCIACPVGLIFGAPCGSYG